MQQQMMQQQMMQQKMKQNLKMEPLDKKMKKENFEDKPNICCPGLTIIFRASDANQKQPIIWES